MIDQQVEELVRFAKRHPGFAEVSNFGLRSLFVAYEKTTLISRSNGEIEFVAIYQDWPDCRNFIAVIGKDDRKTNLKNMLVSLKQLPKKKSVFFDENKMELRTLCRH